MGGPGENDSNFFNFLNYQDMSTIRVSDYLSAIRWPNPSRILKESGGSKYTVFQNFPESDYCVSTFQVSSYYDLLK